MLLAGKPPRKKSCPVKLSGRVSLRHGKNRVIFLLALDTIVRTCDVISAGAGGGNRLQPARSVDDRQRSQCLLDLWYRARHSGIFFPRSPALDFSRGCLPFGTNLGRGCRTRQHFELRLGAGHPILSRQMAPLLLFLIIWQQYLRDRGRY